jgi:hypothetical protein
MKLRRECGLTERLPVARAHMALILNVPRQWPMRPSRVFRFDVRRGLARADQRAADASGGYRFHFQIKDKVGRRACSVNVQAPNVGVAETFVSQNWPMIEAMARDGLLKKSGEGRTIKLATPRLPLPHWRASPQVLLSKTQHLRTPATALQGKSSPALLNVGLFPWCHQILKTHYFRAARR